MASSCRAGRWPDHLEQFGGSVQCLAQESSDTWSWESNPAITGRLSLPAEPQTPTDSHSPFRQFIHKIASSTRKMKSLPGVLSSIHLLCNCFQRLFHDAHEKETMDVFLLLRRKLKWSSNDWKLKNKKLYNCSLFVFFLWSLREISLCLIDNCSD